MRINGYPGLECTRTGLWVEVTDAMKCFSETQAKETHVKELKFRKSLLFGDLTVEVSPASDI